jgi:hypothetical protein
MAITPTTDINGFPVPAARVEDNVAEIRNALGLGSAALQPASAFETPAGATEKITAAISELPPSGIPLTLIDPAGDNVMSGFYLEEIPESWQEEGLLTVAQIGNVVTSIGSYAFADCSSLIIINFPDSLTSIGSYAFIYCGLTSVTIPESVTTISEYTFGGCEALTSVTLPNSLTSIGAAAFYLCTALATITLPDSLTTIGESAFDTCTSLTSITLPDSLTSIGNQAFTYCASLATINSPIPKSVWDTAANALFATADPLTIHVRASDSSWTAGTGLTVAGNENVTVIKDL